MGECTITFEPLGGDGFYGDIAVDDISVKVKVATFPTWFRLSPFMFTVFSGTLTCVYRRVKKNKKRTIDSVEKLNASSCVALLQK